MRILLVLPFFMFNLAWGYNCTAEYDSLGIPHQSVNSREELYYCFGFHHGQDRAWEMDYLRRVGQGRNAEVLGYNHLRSDLMMRLLDLPGMAQKIWDKFPESEKKWLEIYADGVNAGFKTGKNAQEFVDLGIVPEEWHPVNTIAVLLTQSFDQTRKTFSSDYLEEVNILNWGDTAAELFQQDGLPWENNILKEGEYRKKTKTEKVTASTGKVGKLWADFPSVFGDQSGSNNWVIDAKKSKTGKAILANDPHLDLKTPIFWYWIHLKSPEGEVIGGSLPGVPVVATGTNGKVAWGITNAYLNSADATRIIGSKDEDFESLYPLVWFKFGFLKLPFFFKKFERMKSGHPVLPLNHPKNKRVVLNWTGDSVSPDDVLAMLKLMSAKDIDEMDKVLAEVGIPSWNFVFADTNGQIGYHLVGKTYKYLKKNPYGFIYNTTEEISKRGILEPSERPRVLRPKRGYVYTANNRHYPADALYYGGRGYSLSFRGFRIDELLKGKHDVESFKRIQCDRQAVDARFFVPKILKRIKDPLLKNWDFMVTDDSEAVSRYRRLMDIMMEEWAS